MNQNASVPMNEQDSSMMLEAHKKLQKRLSIEGSYLIEGALGADVVFDVPQLALPTRIDRSGWMGK